jgi:POT family proton-dependent oligopeptide transporter
MGLTLLSDEPQFQWLRSLFLLIPIAAIAWFASRGDFDGKRIAAVFVFFIAAMVFWAIFEQAGLTIALFADQLTRASLFGWSFPTAWFQSLNSLFVILLAPIFAWGWLRLGARQPSSPVKFVLGLFFLGLSYLLMVPAALLTAEGRVSPLWLVGLFFLQTVGELFLSPVGLSTMTKLAPARLVGLVLGVWFLGAAWGNKLAGVLGGVHGRRRARARHGLSAAVSDGRRATRAGAGAVAQAADGRGPLAEDAPCIPVGISSPVAMPLDDHQPGECH